MSLWARTYIGFVGAIGLAILISTIAGWHIGSGVRFFTYVALAGLSGGLKIRLPGVTGTLSGGFLIVILAVAELSTSETVAIAVVSILVQYIWHSRTRLSFVQASFNICNVAIAAWLASLVLNSSFLVGMGLQHPLRLALAAVAYFLANCLIVAVVISLTENKPVYKIVQDSYLWSFPFYLVAAALVEGIRLLQKFVGWQTGILVFPSLYAIYKVWTMYADRLEAERTRQEEARIHAEEMSALHLRTIQALAMAIEARDRTTHDHLQRVQIYATEIGRGMGMDAEQLEALRTAAVLHDVGKLAVPEHIISKPGRLTPEEFQKVQAHPVVGAEILERVNFPYGVVPIVRSHHERWDGSGYPAGLKGTDIPVGARILSVVDCFDALSSDRQYRKAMSSEQALGVICAAAGKDFDPAIVEMLTKRYAELEQMVRLATAAEPRMMSREEIRSAVPAAGFQSAIGSGPNSYNATALIGSATQAMGCRIGSASDLVSAAVLIDQCLRPDLGYELMGISLREGANYRLRYLTGSTIEDSAIRLLGQGLTGWVVEEGRPILNGNGRLDSLLLPLSDAPELLSAASVPIQAGDRTAGALTIYSPRPDAFSARDLQVLWGVSAAIGAFLLDQLPVERKTAAGPICIAGSTPLAKAS